MSLTDRLTIVGGLAAITALTISASQGQPQFTSESELVVLHVAVTDKGGSYASGLAAEAFRVFDEGRPQELRFFENEDTPVTVGVLIDSSGSMRTARDRVIAAAADFVQSSNPEDEVFGLVFNDDVRPVLASSEPFTSQADTLRNALADVFTPAGRTSLYDAIVQGLAYGAKGARDRRALVVLSDGGDNASQTTFAEALASVQASNAIVYTVALDDPLDSESNPKRLKQIAETSGGATFAPRDVAAVHRAFQQIARDIRHSYTIGYEPSGPNRRAGFHRIRVEVRSPDGRRLTARARTGYLAKQNVTPHHAE